MHFLVRLESCKVELSLSVADTKLEINAQLCVVYAFSESNWSRAEENIPHDLREKSAGEKAINFH